MIERLTPEQELLMEEVRREWLGLFFENRPTPDPEKIRSEVRWLYEYAGLKAPTVIMLDSPMGCHLAAKILRRVFDDGFQSWDKVGNQVEDQVEYQVWNQVNVQVKAQVREQVRAQVGDQVWDQVGKQVWAQVRAQVREQVWEQVGKQVGDQVEAQVLDQVWDRLWEQVGKQVGDQVEAQVEDQVWDRVGEQVGDQVRKQVGDQVLDQVWDRLWDQVEDQVNVQVEAQVWDQVGEQVRAQLWKQVRAQVLDQVWDRLWDQVEDQVGAQVREQVREQARMKPENPSWLTLLSDATFGAWADYWRRVGIIRCEQIDRYIGYLRLGVFYAIFLRGFAIVCGPPTEIHRDAENRLHRSDGPAVVWPDGYVHYLWHGVRVPAKLIERPDEVTRADLMTEQNAEIRRAYRERLGTDRFASLLDLVDVDRCVFGAPGYAQEYVLHRTRQIDDVAGDHIQFVQVRCHSTGREYFLCVPPDVPDAVSALAWTFRKRREDYTPVAEA